MNILSIENISKTVNDEPLFENVTLGVEEGEKIGIVGKNGEGKSTFLKVIMGILPPDEGKISKNNETDIVMLEQNISFSDETTIESFLLDSDSRKIKLLKQYELALKANDNKTYEKLLPLLEKDDIWSLEVNYKAHLSKLNVNAQYDRRLKTLSGGELKKVALARVLALNPRLLILDEPTNHLDIKTIEYLEEQLNSLAISVIVVTHDRYLLNDVCTTIWELDRKKIHRHPGSYEAYLERRAERIMMEQKEQDRLATILRRELKWLARGPQARTGKDKNRKDRIENMLSSVHNVQDIKQNQFSSLERRLGKKILECEDISFKDLFSSFSYQFKKGDKIGVVGDNGTGKSTLLDILTGHKEPTTGVVDIGVNTVFGYYDQLSRDLNTKKSALEFINDIAERIFTGEGEMSSSQFLEYFGFPPTRQRTEVSVFSGGEKRRLYLISKLALNPNFLVLDEPTNDLDIKTMENLEQYISSFTGCCLIVSHDRAFLDCTCDYLFVIENNKITLFAGSYTQYREKIKERVEEKIKPVQENIKTKREKKGLTWKEGKEKEELEKKMDSLNELILKLEESFSDIQANSLGSLQERSKKYEEAKAELEKSEERYLELLEKEEG
ncbi:ABC-F family ATP-binding cassette domain-containing protein [Bullifex porci]|uniref:ABC-F family ATP-binding cassette domain-containing protein n=1 Tax=Bullifex porci TaxID=2606638 RepID=UPI0023F3ACDB|nr:ABC-F family ATP-binding cassette domain-containing protein [Bullifex porci]MDD7254743.1 ABC-F family ATP-binding cassette domain-containing protein [Bullifex porci]MDY2741178.1 ABC-F family ATP-binding cassette domain-containing protein [Bullifex porci]